MCLSLRLMYFQLQLSNVTNNPVGGFQKPLETPLPTPLVLNHALLLQTQLYI